MYSNRKFKLSPSTYIFLSIVGNPQIFQRYTSDRHAWVKLLRKLGAIDISSTPKAFTNIMWKWGGIGSLSPMAKEILVHPYLFRGLSTLSLTQNCLDTKLYP